MSSQWKDDHDELVERYDALLAERQQAIDERDAAQRKFAKRHAEYLEVSKRCEQAIDALREIKRRPIGAFEIASAALLSLGEQP